MEGSSLHSVVLSCWYENPDESSPTTGGLVESACCLADAVVTGINGERQITSDEGPGITEVRTESRLCFLL